MRVSSLHYYPIKGCRGHSVAAASLDALGFEGDRRLMLIDARGRFISQREEPRLATVEPELDGHRLTVRAPHQKPLALEINPDGAVVDVTVWESAFRAHEQGEGTSVWFSEVLGSHTRLVWWGAASRRPIDPTFSSRSDAETTFTDGYQALIAQEESLADLNTRLAEPVPMGRFRPNIVVQGGVAWGEDKWREVKVGSMVFDAVKPCARCVVTTTDQLTGAKHPHQEPLRTLAAFRNLPGFGAIFGQNLILRAPGSIAVGDAVIA